MVASERHAGENHVFPYGGPGLSPSLFLQYTFKFLRECRNDFEEVADYAVCGDFKDRGVGVFIDRDDDF